MRRRRYRKEIATDLREAVNWYDDQRQGLGDRFFRAAEVTMSRIEENSEQFPIIYRDLRRALLPQPFPYQVFFRIRGEWVEILAVTHSSRSPHIWKRRL